MNWKEFNQHHHPQPGGHVFTPLEKMDSTFRRAWNQFLNLPGVDADPARCNTIADLVYIAQFEIDLFEAGEIGLSKSDIGKIRTFVRRWKENKQ